MKTMPSFQPSPYSRFMQEAVIETPNGLSLHVEVGGNPDHPCILLIMGLGGQMIHWPDQFCETLIQQGFYVIRFDNRDIGLSSKTEVTHIQKNLLKMMIRFKIGLKNTPVTYTLEDMADDAFIILKQLHIKTCYIIGASMGGMIAQILAAKHPSLVARVGLLFTSNNARFLPNPGIKQLQMFFTRAKSAKEEDVVQHNIKIAKNIGSPSYINVTDIRKISKIAYQRSYAPFGVLQQLLAILCTGSLLKWDKKITQPTLVIHGACDKLLPPKHGKAVAKAINGAKFELISGMGHDIPTELIPQLSKLFVHHFKS
ncbi:alpha/beta fold hydrolase [Acinetobacter pollinis]|uniref:Alpha/beta hydrolase n=1 Tax=Acinetobacter pollinis TaxID=2605270 RepID=A0ABU6DRK1_9GAMM|nr:alpha/beta hydrolase [Acinetobacter pollinis]